MSETATTTRFDSQFEVHGEWCDERGNNYMREVCFLGRQGERQTVLISLSDLNASRVSTAICILDDAGAITPFSIAEQKSLVSHLRTVKPRYRGTLVGRNGAFENGDVFLFDGHAYGTGGRVRLHPKLERHSLNHRYPLSKGDNDLSNWKRTIAEPVLHTPVLMVTLCLPFVGLIAGQLNVSEGFGLMLVGKTSIGKSLALRLAASVWAHPDRFVRKWNATENSLEPLAALHSHTLLPLDETGALGGGKPAEVLLRGIMRLVGSTEKHRVSGGLELDRWFTVLLASSEKGLAELARQDRVNLLPGHTVRLIEVPAEGDRSGSIFEVLPDGMSDEGFHEELHSAAGQYYGVAGDACMKELANDIAKHGRGNLVLWLEERRDEFLAGLKPRPDGGAEHRIASHFSLIFAAGRLATEYGILPFTEAEIFAACECVLNRSLALGRHDRRAKEKAALEAALSFLTETPVRRIGDIESGDNNSLIQHRTQARDEVWIEPRAILAYFGTAQTLTSLLDDLSRVVRHVAHSDGKATVPRQGLNGRRRYVVFAGTVSDLKAKLRGRLRELDDDE